MLPELKSGKPKLKSVVARIYPAKSNSLESPCMRDRGEVNLNSNQIKEIIKSALFELFSENRAEVSALLTEIIEDIAMERAISEGQTTEIVSRETISFY